MSTLTWIDSVVELDRDEWNALATDCGFYSGYDWLLAFEAHPAARARYLVLRSDQGRALAAVPIYRVREETNPHYQPSVAGQPATAGPSWVLGSRRGYRSGVLVTRELVDEPRRTVLAELRAELVAELGREPAELPPTWWYVPDSGLADVQRLSGGGARSVPVELDAAIPLTPGGFPAYVEALPPKRRRKIRAERRRFLDAGYQVGRERLADVAAEAGPLLAQLEAKYGQDKGAAAMTGYLQQLADLADPGEVIAARQNGELIGYCHYFVFGEVLWARTAGFDYARLKSAFEYFNVSYYELIDRANEVGAHTVHLGIGSLEAKSFHGARTQPLWAVEFEATDRS